MKIDKPLLWLTAALLVLGLLAVSSASAPLALRIFSDPYNFARQQIVWSVIGIVALFISANIHYSYWRRAAFAVAIVAVVLLFLVLIPGLGSSFLGARRWLYLGPVGLQPSEFAKFAVVVLMARLIVDKYPYSWGLGAVFGFSALIMLQPDLGTTLVIAGVGVAQLFIGGMPAVWFLGTVAFGAIAAAFMVLTSGYRRARLMTFLESSTDPLGASYHMRQILIALGSGGLFGLGLGQSRQKHLFLPETATDSVFAIIAEENGFFGALLVILLLTLFLLRIFKIAKNAPDEFSKLLATGIGVWLSLQTFLNLSSVVAITPITGIPLPFFSYGGSSLVMILFSVGIILNISRGEAKSWKRTQKIKRRK